MKRPTSAQKRLDAVRERMRAARLDALLITNPENRQYVTDYYAHDSGLDSAGRVLVTADRARLLTDDRYVEQAHEEAPHIEISSERGALGTLVATALGAWGWKKSKPPRYRLGIEASHMTVAQREDLVTAGRGFFRVVPVRGLVEPLREAKGQDEIDLTRRATEITCETFTHLLAFMRRPNLTEKLVAAEIVATMLRLGADVIAFEPIVAGGPLGARPHAVPGDRPLMAGQPIIIDMGARVRGYCADMTRTVFLDHVPPVWAERYRHVLAANLACEKKLRAGIAGRAIDQVARDTLAAAGLADYFTHGLGHGTGLEIHEDPRLGKTSPDTDRMPVGAIVTIEPGVYFPGEGGVRIEDAAVLTATGCDILTTSPKELEAMIIKR